MASSDNDDQRMLSLLEALFQGQDRMLRLVVSVIEKFSVVETRMSMLNRKVNIIDDLALRQHSEIVHRFDAIAARLELNRTTSRRPLR